MLIFTAVFAVFAPTLNYPFVRWDDYYVVVDNTLLGPMSWARFVAIWTQPHAANYYPFTLLSLWLDARIFGMEASGFRLTNIALHAGATVALAWAIRQLGVSMAVAALVALFFGLHPLRVESVVWVAERKDVLCGIFYILALGAWLRAERLGEVPGNWWLGAAVLAGVAALLSKSMAVSLPLVLAVRVLLFAGLPARRAAGPLVILILAAMLVAWLNVRSQQDAIRGDSSMIERVVLAGYAPLHHAMSTLWPVKLSPLHPVAAFTASDSGLMAAAIAMANVMALGAAVVCIWKMPNAAFGLLGAALALGPVSGIVPIGMAFAADRYSYIPTAVLLIGLAPVVERLIKPGRRMALFLGGGAVALLVPLTMAQSTVWSSSWRIWQRTLEVYPQSEMARGALAGAWIQEARAAGVAHGRGAEWGFARTALGIHAANGAALDLVVGQLTKFGRPNEARLALERALADRLVEPRVRITCFVRLIPLVAEADRAALKAAAMLEMRSPNLWLGTVDECNYMGFLAEGLKEWELAAELYERGLRIESTNPNVLVNLAFVRIQQGRLEDAMALLERSVTANPDHAASRANLARLRGARPAGSPP